jgi:mitogen-activated protein kinase kinase kinase
MFHIGVATQHPPLPEPGQLSQLGISFIKDCLTIDPLQRPSATELMEHPWMIQFRETFLNDEPDAGTNPQAESSEDSTQQGSESELDTYLNPLPSISPQPGEFEEVYEYDGL